MDKYNFLVKVFKKLRHFLQFFRVSVLGILFAVGFGFKVVYVCVSVFCFCVSYCFSVSVILCFCFCVSCWFTILHGYTPLFYSRDIAAQLILDREIDR